MAKKEHDLEPKTEFIAEFCQNHNGDFEVLKRMLDAALNAGATFAKIQTIFANDLSYRERFEKGEIDDDGRVVSICRPYITEYERLKTLELTYEEQSKFVSLCLNAGIKPLTTAFTVTSIPAIRECGFTSIKIASYDCASTPLLKSASSYFDEVIVSTGATFLEEIEAAVEVLKFSGVNFSVLHCVTIYPTPLDKMNLRRMLKLKDYTPNVGLSSHPLNSVDGTKADMAAIYLGARLIERHFTILPEKETRDGKVSVTDDQLKELVNFSMLNKTDQYKVIQDQVPEYASIIGKEELSLSSEELLNRDYYKGRFCNKVGDNQVFNWDAEPFIESEGN
jgi:sialic acid synthase SpsE